MPFQKGHKHGGKHGGDQGGGVPKINPLWRDQFYKAMHQKMLPLAEKILLRCLKHKDIEHNKWAVEKVLRKCIPDSFNIEAADGANSLATLIEKAAKEKFKNDLEDIREKDKKIPGTGN